MDDHLYNKEIRSQDSSERKTCFEPLCHKNILIYFPEGRKGYFFCNQSLDHPNFLSFNVKVKVLTSRTIFSVQNLSNEKNVEVNLQKKGTCKLKMNLYLSWSSSCCWSGSFTRILHKCRQKIADDLLTSMSRFYVAMLLSQIIKLTQPLFVDELKDNSNGHFIQSRQLEPFKICQEIQKFEEKQAESTLKVFKHIFFPTKCFRFFRQLR